MTLRPYPFGALVARALMEHDRESSIFGLPERRWFTGCPSLDLSVVVHGSRLATPFGVAAGPHTQLAQNIVLSWLAGARSIELKTVQERDALDIPRPCIDVRTTGFNIEWSQELPLHQSAEEYVKASMLVQILVASGVLPAPARGREMVFELSLGYDLAGIRSESMTRFLRTMVDARAVVERLRQQIPAEGARYRELDFATQVSRSFTLSTFHGCPPSEIESIVSFLLRTYGVDCTVKFNPTLLGPERVKATFRALGYRDLRVPDEPFANDLRWNQAVDLVDRCGTTAAAEGLGFGVKFCNTLVVENDDGFLPATERYRYLSGRPLHAIAIALVRDFRATFGARFPVAFSAGVERWNFADMVRLGLSPVTVCTDLLREGGYARARRYFDALVARMAADAADSVDAFVGPAAPGQSVDLLRRTEEYLGSLDARPELRADAARPPRKIGTRLALFDCLACDKCLPVCPNHALFTFDVAPPTVAGGVLRYADGCWYLEGCNDTRLRRQHQIGVFADFCNECGNCDVFCPEHGGPYKTKPRFFGSRDGWASITADGFWVSLRDGCLEVCGRFQGLVYALEEIGGRVRYSGKGFDVTFDPLDPAGTIQGAFETTIDLGPCALMRTLGRAITDSVRINYANILATIAGADARLPRAPAEGIRPERTK